MERSQDILLNAEIVAKGSAKAASEARIAI
jgi:hypothetical protein